jgi:hypothetical protein
MGLSLRRALDTPDADLIAVFGEEILEERDALAARIRERLEAEGLDSSVSVGTGTVVDDEPAEAAPSTDSVAAVMTPDAPPQVPGAEGDVETTSAAASTSSGIAGPIAEVAEPARPAPQPKSRTQPPARPAVELPEDIDGELSAMAMAFAMAGAPVDLVAEAAAVPDEGASGGTSGRSESENGNDADNR